MILDERETRSKRIIEIAELIMTAARTAPKGKGIDVIEIKAAFGDDISKLAEATRQKGEATGLKFMLRDAENILSADAVILMGTKTKVQGLNCGYCGLPTCDEKLKHVAVPCAINMVDVGIALGSAAATAADLRVDCRIMFSVGYAVNDLNLLPGCHSIYAIPLSISSKNPFFDRRPREQQTK
ncbi:MAG: ferredoxin domain-containing protein [Microbacter sp.]